MKAFWSKCSIQESDKSSSKNVFTMNYKHNKEPLSMELNIYFIQYGQVSDLMIQCTSGTSK